MNNFYFVDKPLDFSSFDVIRILRKKFDIKKIGHTGTLDPLATGGLLIATEDYTKLIPYFEKDTKEYEFDIMLDGVTASFDLGENVVFLFKDKQEYFKNNLKIGDIKKVLKNNFTGKISQIPPKYSALKIDGKRAYDLVRKGKKFNLKNREIEIFNIEILFFEYPKLSLKAKVSAGTYIRSIASDLGELLGTGGYISKLRRTKVGNFDISLAITLDDIETKNSLSISKIFFKTKFIKLNELVLEKINNGLKVKGDFNYEINMDLFVLNGDNITNIVNFDGEFLIPKRKI